MTRRTRDLSSHFAGTIAIVTGGASGIGLALGTGLAEAGAHVVLADVDGAEAQAAASTAAGTAGRVVGRHLDVTDEAAVRDLVQEVVADHGRLDLLVNNAGISLGGPTHELTSAHWQRIIDVNLRGVVHGILAAYPLMIRQGRGQIVSTASLAGLVAPPFVAAYAATRHAVVGLSTALRPEAALHGVRVNVLCPGAVETAILDRPPPPDLLAGASHPVTAREYLGVIRQKPIPADRYAALALAAIAADEGVIMVPPSARALWYLHRLSPRLTGRATALVARQVDRRLIRPADDRPDRGGPVTFA